MRERRSSELAFFIQLGCCDGSTSVAALDGITGQATSAVEPVGGGGERSFIRKG